MTKARLPDLRVEPLSRAHDRAHFSCGMESLDTYLRHHAGQDMRRKASAVFVLFPIDDPQRILGYFTLCATALPQGHVPEEARKLAPRYPLVSATLIGRLAVSGEVQGQGLGSVLLAHALRRAYESADTVGSCMVVVDAIDESAASFYAAHGFARLPESLRLILPMQMLRGMIADRPST